jgi:hypothetical protein
MMVKQSTDRYRADLSMVGPALGVHQGCERKFRVLYG